jgi:Zn-dependent M28 family amino/carboxypeptidase
MTQTKNPHLEIDQKIVGDVYTSSEILDNLTILTDDFGSRFGGTGGEKKAADFIHDKFVEYGLQNVHLEPFEYIGWRRGTTTLEIVSPIQKEIPCISLPHSPACDFEAVLIDLEDGGNREFGRWGGEIAGKIAMVNSKTKPRDMDRWVHRGEKYGRCVMAGASGFIFINHYPAYGPATGGIGNNAEAPIPGISVSYEDGSFLQRLVKRHGEVMVRIKSNDICEPMTSWNVIGEILGSADNPEIVMLGCHYDGHDISQGAQDPASGTVAVMEAARVLAKYHKRSIHTIRFALWGVEEIGLIGSTIYVDQHAEELDQFRFYFNMDGAGSIKQKDVVLNEWSELEPIFEAWQKEMALDFAVGQSVHAHSDHFPFLMQGVPTGGMETVVKDLSGRGYGHTKYDTLDKIELRLLQEAATMGARIALRIANAENWTAARRSVETVVAMLNQPQYREERQIRAKIKAFLAKMQ